MRVETEDTDMDDALRYTFQGVPFTGEIVERDKAGNITSLLTVRNGLAHGPELSWYSDGTLETETMVVNSGAAGTSRRWHPNGQLAEERVFDDRGHLVEVRRWTEDGTPIPKDSRR